MKKTNIFAIFLFAVVFLISASTVNAAVLDVITGPVRISATDVTFDFHRGEEFTADITIRANQSYDNLEFRIDSGIRSEFNIRVEDTSASTTATVHPIQLDANNESTIRLRATIPARRDFTIEDVLVRSGAFRLFSGNSELRSYDLYYNSPNMLEYVSTEIRVNNRASFSANPMDDVEILVTFRNRFNEHNIRIEDIDVDLVIFDFEDMGNYDLEDFAEIRSISRDREGRVSFRFSVPFDTLEDRYDIEISARARDQRGAIHEIDRIVVDSLEIRRNRNDIYIRTATLSRTTLSCENTRTTLDVDVYNIGSRRQDDVTIVVQNQDLGIFQEERNIRLESIEYDDRDARTFRTFNLNIDEDTPVGTYYFDVMVYMSGTLYKTEAVRFDVRECQRQEREETEQPVTPPIVIEERPRDPIVITPQPTEDEGPDFMMFLLAGLNLILIVAVIALLLVVLRKPSKKDKYF